MDLRSTSQRLATASTPGQVFDLTSLGLEETPVSAGWQVMDHILDVRSSCSQKPDLLDKVENLRPSLGY